MAQEAKVNGRRVYVTFLPGDTVAVQASDCTGHKYSRMPKGILRNIANMTDAKAIGELVLKMRDKCKIA